VVVRSVLRFHAAVAGTNWRGMQGESAHFSPEILERSDDSIERLMLVESELLSAASTLEPRAPVCPS
jgi:hypothetical protein